MKFLRIFYKYFIFLMFLHTFSYSQDLYTLEKISEIYNLLNLNGRITFNSFNFAVRGLMKIEERKNNMLTIVDFTKPSTVERMFVIDLDKKEILLSTYVSHGKKSGDLYAFSFSNKNGSHKSSQGFFLTGNVYKGINGKSLEIYGLEKGINDNVRKRDIVIHGATYSNFDFLNKNGRLGRSKGCLAVPTYDNDKLIDLINGGTVCYVHTNEFEKNKELSN